MQPGRFACFARFGEPERRKGEKIRFCRWENVLRWESKSQWRSERRKETFAGVGSGLDDRKRVLQILIINFLNQFPPKLLQEYFEQDKGGMKSRHN